MSEALIRPFAALRVRSDRALEVCAPPYDVLDTEEARGLAAGNPDSFLHVSKPEIDLPPGTDPHAPEVYARGRQNLDRLVADGLLRRDPRPCLYAYRLRMGEHVQTGVAAAASVAAYRGGRIKIHEHTRPDKEADRVRHADALDAHTGPVFLTYRQDAAVDRLVQAACAASPAVDFVADDGVRHSLWVVDRGDAVDELVAAFDDLDAVYIADGHHRSAAAERLCERRDADHPDAGPEAPWRRFLAVLFPDDQVRILPYNRVVTTLGGEDPRGFVEQLGERFRVEPAEEPVAPGRPHRFGLYVGGRWYRLEVPDEEVPEDDPVRRLDISLLSERCLQPLLGIRDPRTDSRIDFVGGIRGLAELERRVDSGEAAAAFSLHATRLRDVFAVADSEAVMPPKSTWFEPKLRDGLVSLSLTDSR